MSIWKLIIAFCLGGTITGFVQCTANTTGAVSEATSQAREDGVGSDIILNIFFVGDSYYFDATGGSQHHWDWYPQSMLNMMTSRFATCVGCRKEANVKLLVSGTYALGKTEENEFDYLFTSGVNLVANDTEFLFSKFISQNEKANASDVVVLLTGRRVMDNRKNRKIIPGFSIKDQMCKEKKYVFIYDPPFTYFGYWDLAYRLGDVMGAYTTAIDYKVCGMNSTTPFHKCSVQDVESPYNRDCKARVTTHHGDPFRLPPGMFGPRDFNITAFCEAFNMPPLSVRLHEPNISMDKCQIQCTLDNKSNPVVFSAPDGVPCDIDVTDRSDAKRGTPMTAWTCIYAAMYRTHCSTGDSNMTTIPT